MTEDRKIGALLGCCAASAEAKHPREEVRSQMKGHAVIMFPAKALELRILQLYIWSLDTRRFIDGSRTATVARYGAYEVRLVEPLVDPQGDTIPFWIELFDHKSAVTIDSCGGHDFEETAVGAAALILQASLLHRDAIACRQAAGRRLWSAASELEQGELTDCC
jgi:hypothetical protein